MFHLNGEGVSYNGKGRSVFVLFRKNGTITLYYRMYMRTYVCVDYVGAPAYVGTHALYLRCVHTYVHTWAIQGSTVTSVVCAWPMSGCYEL